MGILQNHCQDNLWYRVPRDAPSFVDLGAFMFKQSDAYRLSGEGLSRNVATVVSIHYINFIFKFILQLALFFYLASVQIILRGCAWG